MRRVLKGIGALVVLAAIVGGVPWLLSTMVGNPLPTDFQLSSLWHALSRPDDGTILIKLVAVIAWIAWVVFTVSLLADVITVVSHQRIRIRLPGLGGSQKLAGGLVLLVMAMFLTPHQLAAAAPVPTGHHPGPATSSADDPAPGSPTRPGGPDDTAHNDRPDGRRSADRAAQLVHVVKPGDDLWSLSEHYYGKGQEWRRIARANPALLTGGPDRLEPGWRLHIPDVERGARRVIVRAGDTLSAIAGSEYGDPLAWQRIYDANRDVLTDPDLLPVGTALVIPAHYADAAADASGTRRETSGDRSVADHTPPARQRQQGESAGGQRQGDPDVAAGDPQPPVARRPTGPTSSTGGTNSSKASTANPTGTSTDQSAGQSAPTATGAGPAANAGDGIWSWSGRFAGVGGLMAAAVIGGLAARRQLQLRGRAVGRRIPQPPPEAQQLEAELGRAQMPEGLELLSLALRAIGRDCYLKHRPLPGLQAARSTVDELVLLMAEPDLSAPVGFVVDGNEWRLGAFDAHYLAQDAAVVDAAQPYPTVTSLGTAPDGSVVLINLESAGLFAVDAQSAGSAGEVLTAMATELAFSPWADELVVTLVGDDHGLADSIDRYNVSRVPDLDHLLDRWEQRARVQRDHLLAAPGSAAGDYRIDPDLADPWVPEVGLILVEPDSWQCERLERLLLSDPPVTIAAVVTGGQLVTDWRLAAGGGEERSELAPLGWPLSPQLITERVGGLINDLITTTGSQETEPAPWWVGDFADGGHRPARALIGPPSDEQPDVILAESRRTGAVEAVAGSQDSADIGASIESGIESGTDPEIDRDSTDELVSPTALVAAESWPLIAVRTTDEPIDELVARSNADWAWLGAFDRPRASKESAIVPNPFAGAVPPAPRHPTIMLLGPAELLGAAGDPPARAVMQCIEYCTWLLEHPGSTAQAMAAALAVAEGTRRSNVSRLRNWLGSDDQGEPYLPDAYSGKIILSPLVSSDWHRLQLLTHAGVDRTSTEGLAKALDLVRGAPLADAAPGQWHWAEEMRTDMVSVIRDIGVELADRARAESEIDLARWAASRALTAAPQDEFLMGVRIRTEHQAGNPAEVERLALQLAAQGRALGVDLHPDTVDLLQQVMEGRLRARA